MEPTFSELTGTLALDKAISVDGKTFSSLTLKRLIKRPLMKRIVFITEELDRIVLYEGDTDFLAHKDDSEQTLISALKTQVEKTYSK